MISVLIVEDNARMRGLMQRKVELDPQIRVVEAVPNGAQAVAFFEGGGRAQVVLMDLHMPVMDGIEATRRIKAMERRVKVLVTTVLDDPDHIRRAVAAGADGYLLKSEPPDMFHHAIRRVLGGDVVMSDEIARKTFQIIREGARRPAEQLKQRFGLSDREIEILWLLCEGLSYRQIAHKVSLSEGTIRKHIENSYRKLRVHNKVEAVNIVRKYCGG